MMEMLEGVKEMVRQMPGAVPDADADFDWDPVMFVRDRGGQVSVVDARAFLNEDKGLWRATLASIAARLEAVEVVLVTSAWRKDVDEDNPDDGLMPSESPDRIESVMLTYAKADGTEKIELADIERDGVHVPTLGEWKDMSGATLAGPVIEELRRALR